MIRPPCTPPEALMAAPQKLAALPGTLSQAAALDAWLDDMRAYQDLRGQTGALQASVGIRSKPCRSTPARCSQVCRASIVARSGVA